MSDTEEKTEAASPAGPGPASQEPVDAPSRFPELEELQRDIERRLRDNQRFLERFMDEDFQEEKEAGDEEGDDENFEEL